jgi:hypothetical protein
LLELVVDFEVNVTSRVGKDATAAALFFIIENSG